MTGKHKSDVIDAELLSRAGEGFDVTPTVIPDPTTLALQRACRRRHKVLVDANRTWRRIVALTRWAFPDTWNACVARGLPPWPCLVVGPSWGPVTRSNRHHG